MRLSHLYVTHTLCDHGNRKVCDGLDGQRLSFGPEMRLELLGRKGERPIHLTVPASHLFLSNLILLTRAGGETAASAFNSSLYTN